MFDFTSLGSVIAFTGILFISLIGWRLIPKKPGTEEIEDMFKISDYTTEIKVLEGSPLIDKQYRELKSQLGASFSLIGIKRGKSKNFNYNRYHKVKAGDELIIEASDQELKKILDNSKLKITHEKDLSTDDLSSVRVRIMEAVVRPDSGLEGRSARAMGLRHKHAINLLAISRTGKSFKQELGDVRLRAGDVVLVQGDAETLRETITDLGMLPLAERNLNVSQYKYNLILSLILLGAISLAALQILPVAISFATAVLLLAIFKVMPSNTIYKNIDWSILLSIAAMLPIGDAMQSTGAAQYITEKFLYFTQGSASPVMLLTLIMLATILLSNIVSNAASAVIMAPIAIHIAEVSQVNIDSLLMGVVVGASCSFLTPVANQNNLLVMGPGSYRFIDYFYLGMPLEIIIVLTTIPAIAWIWPF